MENDDFNFLGGPSEERLKKAMYQMKAEPWNRCLNETTYDTDDLTRLVLVSQELVPLLGNTWRSSPLLACQVWFRNFTPGEASHKEARETVPGAKASLVKTSRISAAHCPYFGQSQSWVKPFFAPNESGHSYGVLVPIVKPTAKFFEDIGVIETLLLCDKIAPPQLAEQIIWKMMRVDCGRYSMNRTTRDISEKVQEAARVCTIKFKSRGVDRKSANRLRLAMAQLKSKEQHLLNHIDSEQNKVKRAHEHLGQVTSQLSEAMNDLSKHHQTLMETLGKQVKHG